MIDFAADPKIFIFATLFSIFWVLPWKGVALWKATRNSHKKWFIAILILNTFAILEIIYIFIFSKRKKIARSSQAEPNN